MKKHVRSVISLALLLGVMVTSLATAQAVEPRYTGISQISSNLSISSGGAASCRGEVRLYSGYTADVVVELKQDGTTIETWTDSGSGTIRISETRYVKSGHNYVVKTSATVYDSNGKVVESPYKNSLEKSY